MLVIPELGESNDEKGYAFETAVLGVSSRLTRKRVREHYKHGAEFMAVVSVVKDIQNKLGDWNPKEPRTEPARILFDEVSSHLKLEKHNLRLYISVGTQLDYDYGADFFFALKRGNVEAIVTVDLTVSKRKEEHKAEIVITVEDLRDESRRSQLVEIISRRLEKKLEKISKKKKRRNSNFVPKYLQR